MEKEQRENIDRKMDRQREKYMKELRRQSDRRTHVNGISNSTDLSASIETQSKNNTPDVTDSVALGASDNTSKVSTIG